MLTSLEKTVIDAILEKQGDPFDAVRAQLQYATVSARRFTGVGFFTDFVIPPDAPVRRDLADTTFGDIGADLPTLKHGVGFLLFVRRGTITMLEGFSYDEPWPDDVSGFKIKRHSAA